MRFFFALAVLMLTAVIAAGQTPVGKPYVMEGPQITLPPNIKATKDDPRLDFVLYRFHNDKKKQILFAYIGGHPSFPNEAPKTLKPQATTITGHSAKSFSWTDKKGGLCREVLVKTKRKDFAQYVHFIYGGLTADEAKQADDIIATVRSEAAPKNRNKPANELTQSDTLFMLF